MQLVVYDGSFTGLLSAVFDVYEYKFRDVSIVTEAQRQDTIFGEAHIVYTDEAKAARVWKGLKQRLPASALTAFYKTYLSEERGMEDMLLQYAQYAFSSSQNIEQDYSHAAVSYITATAKKVHREKHRMEAFVRFQQTADGLYYATVEPDFNVLPLISTHFEKRYADQQWMIYDVKRKYGIYYNLQSVAFVDVSFNTPTGKETDIAAVLDESEELYQHLWQKYFNSVNIAARKNMKLHIRHMPYRYWKYLTEKQSR